MNFTDTRKGLCWSEGTLHEGTLQEGTLQEGTLQEGTLQEGTLQEGTLQEGTLQEACPYLRPTKIARHKAVQKLSSLPQSLRNVAETLARDGGNATSRTHYVVCHPINSTNR